MLLTAALCCSVIKGRVWEAACFWFLLDALGIMVVSRL